MKRVTLLCNEGSANKQYTIWLEPQNGGLYTVESQYGPVGGWVQSASKTPKPVSLDQAEKVYEKVMREKLTKGYRQGADAPAFSQTEGAVDTGLRPMLLTDCSEEGPDRFIEDDKWAGQEKINGKRIMLRVTPKGVVGANRRGLECPIPKEVQNAAAKLTPCVLDGELVGTTYHAFDLLEDRSDLRAIGMAARHLLLTARMASCGSCVKLVPLTVGTKEKRALVKRLRDGRREGVVFKTLAGTYVPGKIENVKKAIAVKAKFYAEVAVEVIRWTEKSSVEVGLLDGSKIVSVGRVTVPAKYVNQVKIGRLIRVRYLYATEAKQLYQAHLDPADDGNVKADQAMTDSISALKLEGKEE